jgi:mannose-1-phosphate guanylyltransferase
MTLEHFYAVIMAGGGGTRLWPVSRKSTPKQVLKIFGERSLFQLAVDRLDGLFPQSHRYVVTVAEQARLLQSQTSSIPEENYLIEPAPRGTAAVVAMAASTLLKKDPNATLAILTADHFIGNLVTFHHMMESGYNLAQKGFLVTMGIKPTSPATGYGYIESGQKLGRFLKLDGFAVKKFIEKPDETTAREFLSRPGMNWNSGMFIWRADVILQEFEQFMPDLCSTIHLLHPYLGVDHSASNFVRTWQEIRPQTIDYGIMEKSSRTAVIPVKDLEWNDVGSWDSFFEVMQPDENGNLMIDVDHIGINTTGSLVVANDPHSLVVTLGMKDVIVVKTPDAVLICPRGQSQQVKELVNYLKLNNYTLYL